MKGAKFDVSNKQRLGFSEVQLVQKMIDGACCITSLFIVYSPLLSPRTYPCLSSPLSSPLPNLVQPLLPSLISPALILALPLTGVSKVIELEKFLSSGGSPSAIRTLLRTGRSTAETQDGKGEGEGEVEGEAEAVEEAEVVLEADITAGAQEQK